VTKNVSRDARGGLILLFACALGVRVLFNVVVVGLETPGLAFNEDWQEYDVVAWALASGEGLTFHGKPYTCHGPAFPAFLGAVYAVFGHSYAAAKIALSVLGSLTCVLIALIGERVFAERVGWIAGGIAALYPFLVFYTGFLLVETMFVFLLTLALYFLVRIRETPTLRWRLLAGLVLGLASLTRSTVVLMPVMLFGWAWIEFGTSRRAAVVAGTTALALAVVLLGWTLGNYQATDTVAPLPSCTWLTLYGSHNEKIMNDPDAVGGWIYPEPMEPEGYRAAYFAFLRQYLVHRPVEFLALEFHKLKRFWNVFPRTNVLADPAVRNRDGLISLFSYGLLLPLSLLGVFLAFRSGFRPWLFVGWVLYFCAVTLLTLGNTRYRLPVEPVIILFSSFALHRAWAAGSAARARRGPAAPAGLDGTDRKSDKTGL